MLRRARMYKRIFVQASGSVHRSKSTWYGIVVRQTQCRHVQNRRCRKAQLLAALADSAKPARHEHCH